MNDYVFHENRGLLFLKEGRLDFAIIDFEEAIRIDPNKSAAYFLRGLIYIHLKEYQKAINDFNKSIMIQSLNPLAFYNRGLAHKELIEFDKSLRDLTKAKEQLKEQLFEFDKSLMDLTKAKEEDPSLPNIDMMIEKVRSLKQEPSLLPNIDKIIEEVKELKVKSLKGNSSTVLSIEENFLAIVIAGVRFINEENKFGDLSVEGQFEVMLFNSVYVLIHYQQKYPEKINEYLTLLLNHSNEHRINKPLKDSIDFIFARLTFYDTWVHERSQPEKQVLIAPAGILHYIFFKKPLCENPELDFNFNDYMDLNENLIFYGVIVSMLKFVDNELHGYLSKEKQ